MAGPARAGVLIYARDLDRLARFYESVFSMRRVHADADRIVLTSDDSDLVIHATSTPMPDDGTPRTDVAIKPFFAVGDLDLARAEVDAAGGTRLPGDWSGPGFSVCNACDPEGNIVQLRAFG